ncbi:hypothetical protein C3L23_00050 [Nautilia sp. PV-1]|uniref:hypothetical protein n=1 Tax=Nautilia sp. PV-1 TaxID=2579250 RepID=UPI000FD8C23F|nr:hypothetical protein [Nautilia sp. PV-1]AZV45724.1 hypothetical protein C3L23_00050 [Nautilia sp. PV-1]
MNKKILILTGLLLLLITANFFNLYIKSKKELKNEYQNYIVFYKSANEFINLKNRYSEKPVKMLKSICSIKNSKIKCTNLSKNQLRTINQFLKSNVKIKKFSISSNKGNFDFYAEIIK